MSNLFKPLSLGNYQLENRVALAPLTRFRAADDHTPSDLQAVYYGQRAQAKGTLLITEATFIRPEAGGYKNAPGIWTEKQASAWKKVADAVHEKGSIEFMQLWALGRMADPRVLGAGGYE